MLTKTKKPVKKPGQKRLRASGYMAPKPSIDDLKNEIALAVFNRLTGEGGVIAEMGAILTDIQKKFETINRALEEKIGAISPTVQEHQKYHQTLDTAIGELCEKLKKANDRIDELKSTHNENVEEYNRDIPELKSEVEKLKSQISDLHKSYGHFRKAAV